jgi:hypothetical protein
MAVKQLRTRALQVRSERLPRQPFAFSSKDAIVLATDPMSQVLLPLAIFQSDLHLRLGSSCSTTGSQM